MSIIDEIEKYNIFDEDYSVPSGDRNVRIRGYIIGTTLFMFLKLAKSLSME